MSVKKHSQLHQWERAMINAYHNYQWHLVLDPLYEKFQDWKAGRVSHLEMDETIHETHNYCQKVYSLFTSKRDFLLDIIQFDEGWFPQ